MAITDTGKQKLREDEKIKIYFENSRDFLVIDGGTHDILLYREEDTEELKKGKYQMVPAGVV